MLAANSKPPQAPVGKSTPLRNIGHTAQPEVSVWVRVGLPLALALLAGGLNLAAVRRELTPTTVYVMAQDLPLGTVLTADHLRTAQVAGDIDRNCLVTPAHIIQTADNGTTLSLQESLKREPRILSKRMSKSEPLTKSCLSGRATAEPGTEVISIPRSLISGGGIHLQPGQEVNFVAQKRHSTSDSKPQYIGPFRVALEERKSNQSTASETQGSIALMYPLTPDGRRDDSANLLHEAALKESQYSLVIIEKAPSKRKPEPAAAKPRDRADAKALAATGGK